MRCMRTILMLLAVGFAATPVFAQSTAYHLHNESSPNFFFHGTLKTAGPDVAGVTFQSPDLKGRRVGTTGFKNFESLAGIGAGGVIPAKSTIGITLYMRKT